MFVIHVLFKNGYGKKTAKPYVIKLGNNLKVDNKIDYLKKWISILKKLTTTAGMALYDILFKKR